MIFLFLCCPTATVLLWCAAAAVPCWAVCRSLEFLMLSHTSQGKKKHHRNIKFSLSGWCECDAWAQLVVHQAERRVHCPVSQISLGTVSHSDSQLTKQTNPQKTIETNQPTMRPSARGARHAMATAIATAILLLLLLCVSLIPFAVRGANLQFGMRAGWNSTSIALEAGSHTQQ